MKLRKLAAVAAMFVGLQPGLPPVHNADWMTNDLQAYYRSISDLYFNNSLPDVEIRYVEATDFKSGEVVIARSYPKTLTGGYVIEITPYFNRSNIQARLSLWHEVCHITNWHNDSSTWESQHGADFQKCMLDAAEMHAFDRLW